MSAPARVVLPGLGTWRSPRYAMTLEQTEDCRVGDDVLGCEVTGSGSSLVAGDQLSLRRWRHASRQGVDRLGRTPLGSPTALLRGHGRERPL